MAQPPIHTVQVSSADEGEGAPSKVPLGLAATTYNQLKPDREPFLQRARAASELTMPGLFREEGAKGTSDIYVPWTTIGAWLCSNLAAKVLRAMFPPGRPPMRLKQDARGAREMAAMEQENPAEAGKLNALIQAGLSAVETEFVDAVEADGDRAKLAVTILKLIIGGTHCLKFYPDGTVGGKGLEHFVCKRDPQGNLIKFVVEDGLAFETLDPAVRLLILDKGYKVDPSKAVQPSVKVYTMGRLLPSGNWELFQETWGWEVPESRRQYTAEECPYQFLPWLLLDEEDYGRSYCEWYLGDLQVLEGFEQTISEGSAALARYIEFVNPTGLTDKRAVQTAENGAVLSGRKDDVTVFSGAEKARDFASADARIQAISQRLARAFLVLGSVIRQAERVTVEEIVRLAQELEEVLGGVYSLQVVTFQIPYVKKKLRVLMRTGRVRQLPEKAYDVQVIGGMAALGRNAELDNLDRLIAGLVTEIGPEGVREAINPRVLVSARANALQVNIPGLIYTEAEATQNRQQALLAQLAEKTGPSLVTQAGRNITENQVAETKASTDLATAAPATPTAQ